MNDYSTIKKTLSSDDWLQSPFQVLADVANICRESQNSGRELVIRMLEKKSRLANPFQAIVEDLACSVGLHPYVGNLNELSLRNALSHASHRASGVMDEVILHSAQARVLRRLLDGQSVILSAPTSFGKSLLIDLVISEKDYSNVVLIVPTLALVEETRRRMSRFAERYSVITSSDQEISEKNIFVLTQERYLAMENAMPVINFFAIDEFYKLSISKDGERATRLNQAFLKLLSTKAQFYLLGPSIKSIPQLTEEKLNCSFLVEDFQTVAIELHRVKKEPDRDEAFAKLMEKITGQTMVYFQSPASIRTFLKTYLEIRDIALTQDDELLEAAEWTAQNYHHEWLVSVALKHGIGIHHGRLPRSLGRFMVRAFEEGKIKLLLCTSTLIEGVNTAAKNVIVYDNKLNKRALDFFTFNNIRGRSGRMFRHFVGHVYVFSDPPQENLPFVDIPVVAPDLTTPSSILIQMSPEELGGEVRKKLDALLEQRILPVEMLKRLSTIEPEFLLATTEYLLSLKDHQLIQFCWSSRPTYDDIGLTSNIIWTQLGGMTAAKQNGVLSASMMTKWIWDLYKKRSVPAFRAEAIRSRIAFGKTPDDSVEDVLAFLRGWAGFSYPKYLVTLGELVGYVLKKRSLGNNNYLPFATTIEHLFQPTSFSTLEEYGLPTELAERFLNKRVFDKDDRIDKVVERLRSHEINNFAHGIFEKKVIADFQAGLGRRRKNNNS